MKRSREDEYAEAFRLGYERARRGYEPTVAVDRDELTSLDELLGPGRDAQAERPLRRPPTRLLGLVALAVLLVASAFLVGGCSPDPAVRPMTPPSLPRTVRSRRSTTPGTSRTAVPSPPCRCRAPRRPARAGPASTRRAIR